MKRRLFRIAALLTLLPALSACILWSLPGTPVDLDARRQEGMGQLVFVRGTYYGHALLPYYLFLDGKDSSNCLGSLLSSDFFSVPVAPGRHQLYLAYGIENQMTWAEHSLTLEIEAGREYYVLAAKPRWLARDQRSRLQPLDAQTGGEFVTAASQGKSGISGAGDCRLRMGGFGSRGY